MLAFLFILLFALPMLLHATGVIKLPEGALYCTLIPITQENCRSRTGSAGITALYLIPYDDIDHVTGITWDADEQATAIPVGVNTWTKFVFEDNTAFLNQEKQVNGSNINFAQTISINFANNDNGTRKALKALDECCELVAYVVDKQGATRLVGVLPKAASGTESLSNKLKTGAGSYNTGADPAADQNVRTVTLVCNSSFEAVYTTVSESSLPLT